MTHDDLQAWLDRYVAAWLSYDPLAIGDLFSDDVVYRFHPSHEGDRVLRGRAAVVAAWLQPELYDDPATIEARYRPYAVDGDRAVAVGWSRYLEASGGPLREAYDNCYLLRFAGDGRCAEFTEFWVKRPDEAEVSLADA
jgi:ketosteroid isomerase-like protein